MPLLFKQDATRVGYRESMCMESTVLQEARVSVTPNCSISSRLDDHLSNAVYELKLLGTTLI